MRLEEKRLVSRPRDEVFDYTADFSNIAQWDPGVDASRKITPGAIGIGSEFDLDVRFGRSTIPMRYRITEYEPGERVVLRGVGETLEAIDEIVFETQDGMTLIDYRADLTFHNYVRFLEPLIGPIMSRVGKRALDGLAAALS